VLALERVIFVMMFLLALKRADFRNECAPALSLGRPPCSGRVAAMEIAETGCVAVMKTVELT
jgi:hypothetical protein